VEDFTLACGTGSASVAVALWLQGRLPGGHLTVENPGGRLEITIEGKDRQIDALYLEGPAENLQEIEI
jgi:diaminopimelate epimerase